MKLIPKHQTGNIFTYLDKKADEAEPYAAGLGLTGGLIGAGVAASGLGAVPGTAIAIGSNIPSLLIDGYQSARDWYKTSQGQNNLGSALWNTGETALDAVGIGADLKLLPTVGSYLASKFGKGVSNYVTKTAEATNTSHAGVYVPRRAGSARTKALQARKEAKAVRAKTTTETVEKEAQALANQQGQSWAKMSEAAKNSARSAAVQRLTLAKQAATQTRAANDATKVSKVVLPVTTAISQVPNLVDIINN